MIFYFDYKPFGGLEVSGTNIPFAKAKTRLGYVEMPKDKESNLGDHGVRKYDSEVGRFLSVDSKFEKYHSANPFQYSLNNPISQLDKDGKDIIVLIDREGAHGFGHTAVLIGNEADGWKLYSKNGTDEHLKLWGKGINQQKGQDNDDNIKDSYFKDLNEFKNMNKKYDDFIHIKTNSKQDKLAEKAAKKEVNEDYNVFWNSCIDVTIEALDAAGLYSGGDALGFHSNTPNSLFGSLVWKYRLNERIGKDPRYVNKQEKKDYLETTVLP